MREKIKNSEKLRDRILSDEKLLSDLSERIAEILKGKVHKNFLALSRRRNHHGNQPTTSP
jgi:hypothetical protein